MNKAKLGKFCAVALTATILSGGLLPSVSKAENATNQVVPEELTVDMAAFEQLVIEVKEGKITNDTEAEARLAELEAMNLPPKMTTMGSSGSSYLIKAAEVAACIAAVGPFDTATAKNNADTASAAALDSGYSGAHNGKADAFRHSFWNALMSESIGTGQAKEVADIHEEYNEGPQIEHDMDYFNNSKGRSAFTALENSGSSTSEANLKKRIKSDIDAGKMKYIKSGKLVYTNK
ncbi:hypothetical protein P4V41_03535 [Fictibacillus nanhaiensis]|uniref:DUF6973 domain-containing protein n=1 Tax=Fictibacillus nanhaiensis TaxID=742169 RepID=UPI002E1B4AEE|nr:hypothetical protein [Fictibacillus nanhaiensis]